MESISPILTFTFCQRNDRNKIDLDRTDQFGDLRVAVAGPGIVAEGDLILQILLEVLRHLEGKVADQVVIGPEALVEPQPDQLGVDGGELVVGEEEAGDVLVVLGVGREAGEGGEVVVGEVQEGGAGWYCGEVAQSLQGDGERDSGESAVPGGCS